jgi:hypothetical protein
MAEQWKCVDGFADYEVSSLGRVRSMKFGKVRILKPRKTTDGYFSVVTCMNGCETSHRIHRLVASAFLPNPETLPQVDHIDRTVTNNCVDNLRWVSPSQNSFNTHRHYRELYGIYWKPQFGVYQVIVTHNRKLHHVGCTPDVEKAKEIRDAFLAGSSHLEGRH